MGKVIDADNLDEHHVKKFEFTSLEVSHEKKELYNPKNSFDTEKEIPETTENIQEEQTENTQEEQKVSNVDELLQKIEALSSKNISLEMQLETEKSTFDEKLTTLTEEAYQKGREEGVKDTQEILQEHSDEHNIQLIRSITSIDEQVQKHQTFLDSVEEELVSTAIIIAKKIIKKELDENSSFVAKELAEAFLSDLKEASTITLKVNPKDALYIQEHYKENKTIMIDADDAINKGGIIILSDIGNIDGNIDTRLQKAIALIKREG